MHKIIKILTVIISVSLLFIPLKIHAQTAIQIDKEVTVKEIKIDVKARVSKDGKLEAIALSGIDSPSMHILKSVYLNVVDWSLDLNDKQKNEAPLEARFKLNIVDISEQKDFSTLKIKEELTALNKENAQPYLKSVNITPVRYPPSAMRAGVTGEVKTLVKVGKNGKVEDAIILSTQLNTGATNWRKLFENAALKQAYTWEFESPTAEKEKNYWTLAIPMTFSLSSYNSYPKRLDK